MTLARKAGITVATTRVIPLLTANAVAVKRFDRADGGRIHSIFAGTALRAAAVDAEPELSYPALAQLLRRAGVTQNDRNEKDARELFRRMVFNILIDNTDDHEKNHALLVTAPGANGKYELAPAYDVLPTGSGQGYQEFVCGTDGHDSTLANAMSQPGLFGLTPAEAAAEVAGVIDVVARVRTPASCAIGFFPLLARYPLISKAPVPVVADLIYLESGIALSTSNMIVAGSIDD